VNAINNLTMRFAGLFLFLACGSGLRAADPGIDFFENKIRPVLVENCYKCHSANTKTKGGLALDSRDSVLRGGDTGPAIVPGKPNESLLLNAIKYDGEPKMPPDGKLPDAVIADIQKWIAMGAPDPRVARKQITIEEARKRWAYQPLLGIGNRESGIGKNVDDLIRARLAEKKLDLSVPADPRTLVRRLYLDLLGLPPTPEQVVEFVNDTSANAYEKLVDRLLADPHFGERWARHWLDVARFAESSGYEHDNDRPHAYQYRDFVIQAFNRDLPFDKFVQWQIAGDELAPDEPLALKATGFLAAGLMNGQVTEREVEKERYEVFDDWVGTIGTAFLGLTVGCARCHDHKFDPIRAEDYYRMAAHFTSAVRVNLNVPHDPPLAKRMIAEHQRHMAALEAAVRKFEDTKASRPAEAWRASSPVPPAAPWLVMTADDTQKGKTRRGLDSNFDLVRQPDGSYLFTRLNGDVGDVNLTVRTNLEKLTYLRVEALTDVSLPNYGPGFGNNGNFHIDNLSLSITGSDGKAKGIKLEKIAATTGDKPGSHAWNVNAKQAGHDQAAVFKLIEPVGCADGASITITIHCPGDSPSARQTIGRFRLSLGLADTDPSPWGVDMPLEIYERGIKELAGDALTPAVVKLYCLTDSEWQRLDVAACTAKREWQWPAHDVSFGVTEGLPPYRMMIQGPDLFESTHVLKRGDPNKKEAIATPATLALLTRGNTGQWYGSPPRAANSSFRRAALAKWLTDTDNGAGALVARVIVNRLWQHHFGRGNVATPSDFGMQGDAPTHPELLDALAAELVRSGWSLKAIHKRIVMSATYRQASEGRADAERIDPDNTLLWRYSPHRLEAEAIRDSMLSVSGRLDARLFGPGTLDENMTRRSIYFTVKRSQLIPSMVALDWPEALTGIGRRTNTTVPTQALWALNNPQVQKCAEALASKLSGLPPDDSVRRGFEITVGRPPSDAERAAALTFLEPDPAGRLADFAHTLLLRSEFVTIR
jgi:hypothetical protein